MSTGYVPSWLATQGRSRSTSATTALDGTEAPVYRQVITWLLFWPLLMLIARQAPYFAGTARTSSVISPGGGGDYHGPLYIMMLFEAAFAASAWRGIASVLRRNPLVIAGLGMIFLSTLWSDSPGNTFRLGIEVSLYTFLACYLTVRFSIKRLMDLLIFMGVASALLSILFVVALPSYGLFAGYAGGAWQGICDHKNTLGDSMAYLLTPVFFVEGYKRWQRVLYASLLLFLIVMSQARGPWFDTLGVLFFVALFYLSRRIRKQEWRLLFLVTGVLSIAVITLLITSFDTIAPMLGKTATMSGRTGIYREVWHSIMKAPLLGYGYGGFWFLNPEWARIGISIGWPGIGYSESGILELLLQLGAVGTAVVLFMLFRAVRQGVRLLRTPPCSPRVGWYMAILLLAALTNIDAGWLLASGTLDWLLILIACIGLQEETRLLRTRELTPVP